MSNVFLMGFAVQSAQGSYEDAPQILTYVRSRDLQPNAERSQLEETGQGRDAGETETTRISVSGSFELYFRPRIGAMLLYGLFGENVVSGTAPDFTHTVTPGDDQPWLSIFPYWNNQLFERYGDCKITAGTLAGEAGNSLTLNCTAAGLYYEDLGEQPVGGEIDDTPTVRVPGASYNVDGQPNNAISQFSFQLENAQNTQQTNKIYDSFMEPGLRTTEVNYTEVFQSLDEYKKTVYGGPSGMTPSQAVHRNPWSASFLDANDVERLRIDIPRLAYNTAALPVNTNGEIPNYEITGRADRVTGGDIATVEVDTDVPEFVPAPAV